MPLFHPSALTIVAVLITEPASVLPPVITAGLTVFCAIGGTLALLGGFPRNGWKRKQNLNAISTAGMVRARSETRAHSGKAAA